MIFHPADSLSLSLFVLFAFAMAAVSVWAFESRKVPRGYLLIFGIFTALASMLAAIGVFREHVMPAGPLFFASMMALSIFFLRAKPGQIWSSHFTFSQLILFQSFRLPLEILLHHWARIQVIPETMTWTGQNFDVVTGVAALLLFPWARRSIKVVWVFQILGFGLLLNVIRVVFLSLPLPVSWQLSNPLQLPFYFPYVLIAPLFVWPALMGHLILFRKLLGTSRK